MGIGAYIIVQNAKLLNDHKLFAFSRPGNNGNILETMETTIKETTMTWPRVNFDALTGIPFAKLLKYHHGPSPHVQQGTLDHEILYYILGIHQLSPSLRQLGWNFFHGPSPHAQPEM